MKSSTDASRPRRLKYYTPLRYPGGKAKLATYMKALLRANDLVDGEYVEPYAGGSAVALELLFHEYVSKIHINDLSKPVHAFWSSVLNHTNELCRLVRDTPLTVQTWDKQKRIFTHRNDFGQVEVGFAAFFLNRTNRSGILNGGVIGGRAQRGPWKINARFNPDELIFRIESIAKMRKRIRLTRMDALKLLQTHGGEWPPKTLIYLDPPYYEKGRDLYYDFYDGRDHEQISRFLTTTFSDKRWAISYDDVPAIRELYTGRHRVVYGIGYSAREVRQGNEVMFFSDALQETPVIDRLVS
jgi:DNA adenine methylase